MTGASFRYRALDQAGGAATGTLRATSRQDAYRSLVASGLRPTRIRALRSETRVARVGAEEIANFTYQLSVLLDARLPVDDALRSIGEQAEHPGLRAIALDVAQRIQAGATIAQSLAAHESAFGTVYLETIRAAEASGTLIRVLGELATSIEEFAELRRTLRGALVYPAAVLSTLALALLFLLLVVVPRFGTMYADRGVELPLLSAVLVEIGATLRGHWYLLAAGAGAALFGGRALWRSGRGRARLDDLAQRVPILRGILVGLAASRFASVLGISIRAGIGIIDALAMAGRATGSPRFASDVDELVRHVRRGGRLSEALPGCAALPPFVRQLLTAGEEASEIPRMCDILARHHRREAMHAARNVATAIEPLLVVGLAGIVLVVALAVFLPMWNMVAVLE